MNGEAKPGLLILIGLAFLTGAAVLAWFSSVQTLHLTRTETGIVVLHERWLFGFVRTSEVELRDVAAAKTVTIRPQSSRSRPFTHLLFDTPSGPVDLWTASSPFDGRGPEITAFLSDPALTQTTFSSLVDRQETIRFVVAQLAFLFLLLCGVGLVYLAIRSILGTPSDIGPVDAIR